MGTQEATRSRPLSTTTAAMATAAAAIARAAVVTKTAATPPCGARRTPASEHEGFCSLCFDALLSGVVLSMGEVLCDVCAMQTFDLVEQQETGRPPRPPIALLACTDEDGRLCRDDLHGVKGQAQDLLLSLRVGDQLKLCACLPSERVRGRVGSFAGYCMRRRLALLRMHSAFGDDMVCMRMDSTPLLLRRLDDEAVQAHATMLRVLMPIASRATLQHAVATIRAAHTLCGSEILRAGEALLEALSARQAAEEQAEQEEPLAHERAPRVKWESRSREPCREPNAVLKPILKGLR